MYVEGSHLGDKQAYAHPVEVPVSARLHSVLCAVNRIHSDSREREGGETDRVRE